MTEDQLNKEAEDFSAGGWVTSHDYYVGLLKGFKAGYRSRDKEVEDLRKVLESVKDACDWIHLPDWLEQEVKQALKKPA